jgi:CBS domain-containing protein
MAAMFAGASRALLASVVFAFEATRQPIGLLPLLGGCAASFLVSSLLMKNSIMTEKIARRGARVPDEYRADFLDQVLVRDCASRSVVTLAATERVDAVRAWLRERGPGTRHTGFPVLDAAGALLGVVTRTDVFELALEGNRSIGSLLSRPPVVIHEQSTARAAADRMVMDGVGRLVVVATEDATRIVGIVTRSDLLGAHRRRLDEASRIHVSFPLPRMPRLGRKREEPPGGPGGPVTTEQKR